MKLRNLYNLLSLACVLVFSASVVSCGDGEDVTPDANAYLVSSSVICEATDAKIVTEGASNLKYTARIISGEDWCSFSITPGKTETEGKVGTGCFVYFSRNVSTEDRFAAFSIKYSDGTEFSLRLTQRAYSVSATYERDWAEQPEYRVSEDYIYKTYYSYLNVSGAARPVRNYSVCYDRKRRISHWVAYPIHDIYLTPNLSRKDCFGYDPNDQMPAIPMSEQQDITRGYGTGRHDRGHMLPNASRMNNYDINAMTFYATNMMPQNSTLNQNTWAALEGKVRSARHSDTIYVVVGTYFGDNGYITDRSGNRISEPSHVYKLMLRAKNRIPAGKTMADLPSDEILAIGFWFANTSAGNNVTWEQAAVSVAEVEKRTGFKFFRMLDDAVAEEVKARCDLSDWGTLFSN